MLLKPQFIADFENTARSEDAPLPSRRSVEISSYLLKTLGVDWNFGAFIPTLSASECPFSLMPAPHETATLATERINHPARTPSELLRLREPVEQILRLAVAANSENPTAWLVEVSNHIAAFVDASEEFYLSLGLIEKQQHDLERVEPFEVGVPTFVALTSCVGRAILLAQALGETSPWSIQLRQFLAKVSQALSISGEEK